MKEVNKKEYELLSYCNKCKKKVATFVIGLFDCCAFCGFPIKFRKNVVKIDNKTNLIKIEAEMIKVAKEYFPKLVKCPICKKKMRLKSIDISNFYSDIEFLATYICICGKEEYEGIRFFY